MHSSSVLSLVVLVAACGGGGSGGPTSGPNDNPYGVTATGPGVLSVSPIDTSRVIATTPLGNLNPPDHTLPTDHVYISFVDAFNGNVQNADCSKRPIYAAGTGVVSFTITTDPRGDSKIDVMMTKTFHYYYDHVVPLAGIIAGARVTAGQQIATTTGYCPSFDIGVYDLDVTNRGLLTPARYADQALHAVSPYKYMTPSLRALYLARSRMFDGVPNDREGRIDWGVAGRLVGDWFHTSLPIDVCSTGSSAGWAKEIAFVYDIVDNTSPRVAIGGVIANPFVGRIDKSDPDPANVSVANGLVAYHVRRSAFEYYGWVLVQMITADRIKIEFVAEPAAKPAAFTAAAQEYIR